MDLDDPNVEVGGVTVEVERDPLAGATLELVGSECDGPGFGELSDGQVPGGVIDPLDLDGIRCPLLRDHSVHLWLHNLPSLCGQGL